MDKNILRLFVLGLIYGTAYYGIEILYRGYSHFAMIILGSICGLCIGYINEIQIKNRLPLWFQALIGTVTVILLEFIFGCILNLWLKLNIWNYENLKFNIMGQISFQFSVYWYLLSIVVIYIDDLLRHYLFGEEKVKYKIW